MKQFIDDKVLYSEKAGDKLGLVELYNLFRDHQSSCGFTSKTIPKRNEFKDKMNEVNANLGGEGNLRMAQKKAGPIVTDQGNLILDLTFRNGIDQPELLESQINNIPGVLENGLFVNLTDEVLVGKVESDVVGVESLKKI